MRTLQRGPNPSGLARALAELGRIIKTLHVLQYCRDPEYRRTTATCQPNDRARSESCSHPRSQARSDFRFPPLGPWTSPAAGDEFGV